MSLMRHLPNLLTCSNLFSGCIGIVFTLNHSPEAGAWFVWASCAFDFLDGFAARALKSTSPIGKELDSLADVVSFGVLPAVVMYEMLSSVSASSVLPYAAFALTVFSALRLAKFNIDENQKDIFIGLPTPANALFITALPLLESPFDVVISNEISLIGITAVFSFLLVSPLELFALKLKDFKWSSNKVQFTFILLSVLLLLVWQAAAFPWIILLYVASSLIKNWIRI
jgi:CDP-diacylglycerol---serine O-phosphatidyltransferase